MLLKLQCNVNCQDFVRSPTFVDLHNYCIVACTVLPAKSDSDVMFCLQRYPGLRIDISLVYSSYPQDRMNTQVIYQFSYIKWSVQVNVLLNNCKQNITSLSLLVGKTVLSAISSFLYCNCCILMGFIAYWNFDLLTYIMSNRILVHLWTFSSLVTSSLVDGYHAGETYSRVQEKHTPGWVS